MRTCRSLYAIRMAKLIDKKILIGNVVEWILNYKTGQAYSWSKKNFNSEFKSLPFADSLSVILWVFSNGTYFWTFIQHTINSHIFKSFAGFMDQWILSRNLFGYEKVYCWLDNCSSHKSKIVSGVIKSAKIKYVYLPTYSPMLTPVETAFRAFKARLIKQSNDRDYKLKSIEFRNILRKCLQKFSSIEIIGYFKHWFDNLRMYLNGKVSMITERKIE